MTREPLREIRCSRAIFTCRPCRTFTWVLYIQHPNLFNLHNEQAGSLACSPSVYEAAHFSLSETPPTDTSLGLLSSSVQTRCPRSGSWSGHVCPSSLISAQPPHSTSQPHQISPPSSLYQALVSKPLHVPFPTQNALTHSTSAHIILIWPLVFALILWWGELLVIPLPSI